MNTDDLLENPVTHTAVVSAERLLNSATYTVTALAALAQVHDVAGDEVGAALLRDFARRFATHEVETL